MKVYLGDNLTETPEGVCVCVCVVRHSQQGRREPRISQGWQTAHGLVESDFRFYSDLPAEFPEVLDSFPTPPESEEAETP